MTPVLTDIVDKVFSSGRYETLIRRTVPNSNNDSLQAVICFEKCTGDGANRLYQQYRPKAEEPTPGTALENYPYRKRAASMMIPLQAMVVRVIGKCFDNSTVRNSTATENLNHSLKL